ncbi:YkgJ family cysteine cluster protein [Phormidesmis priestleyi ULC007]|uniref:YkgJ family cysteine cluster protein n=1 Tax=Phormidesmis priestleyi ULC007 TaxID=1920490 RepID=A0A2T1DBT1_9CYAN|nr:zinc/iron-chelating domain-containing protein [Phormidesmis priestleyi]PSB17950.1 YkgJ family cysteine cluster protein [Phormidesmis priestleyi ULC007]PZO54023.1 MAG: YkgJ family cysteine cluster protein [Phormidesmis priestleyi]
MSHDRSPSDIPDSSQQLVQFSDIARGLAYLHTRVNATAGRSLESAAFVYALIDLLVETGVITVEQIDDRKQEFVDRLLQRYQQHDPGVALQEPNQDKYTFVQTAKIDCENRVHLCKAACCKMVFPLSRQDIEEGVIRWELNKPYVIAKGADGYCHQVDRTSLGCCVHTQRPIPCRAYDCRNDDRIWLDFDNGVINPKLADPNWPHNLTPDELSLPEVADDSSLG